MKSVAFFAIEKIDAVPEECEGDRSINVLAKCSGPLGHHKLFTNLTLTGFSLGAPHGMLEF